MLKKKTGVNLESVTAYDMLLMIEKGIRGKIFQATHRHAKANNECILSYIEYLDANNLYGWAFSQKLPVKSFKWVKQKKLSNFNEEFIKKI